jgi:hypothetical protein
MNDDPVKTARNHITVACASLGMGLSDSRYAEPVRKLERIAAALDRGDPMTAIAELPTIIGELGQLEFPRPGVATGTDKLNQDPRPGMLSGVAEAVESLEEALRILRERWPEGSGGPASEGWQG